VLYGGGRQSSATAMMAMPSRDMATGFPPCLTNRYLPRRSKSKAGQYFKELVGFYAAGGKNFVSGKQKSTIFGNSLKS
jgi:hypothetical protein